MKTIAINNRSIDTFFGFLSHLGINSKRRLIMKLTESIDEPENKKRNLQALFGSWNDNRDSDTIIKDILDSRVNKQKRCL